MDVAAEKGKIWKSVSVGLLTAFFSSAVLLLLSALVLLKLQMNAEYTELLIVAVYVLSCLTGGWLSGKKVVRKKYLWGLLTGILYFLILFVISGMAEGQVQPEMTRTLLAFVFCGAGGMVGGMLA